MQPPQAAGLEPSEKVVIFFFPFKIVSLVSLVLITYKATTVPINICKYMQTSKLF